MLARTFLRICALEALRPAALLAVPSPAWPTLAQGHVFDSRIEPISDLTPDMRRPVVVLYTEEDNQDRRSQGGGALYASVIDLVFEISVVAIGDDAGEYVPGIAFSDPELEADLDMLEQQVWHALHYGPTGALFRSLARVPFQDWRSLPHRTAEEGFRLAMRTIRAKVSVKELCWQAAPATTPAGLARLPAPLDAIAAALASTSYGGKLAAGMATAAPVMPTATPLQSVGLTAQLDNGNAVEASADGLDQA